ncbi:hypothetical protein H6G54_19790 [Anabaena cylindrica FACHB-243]|uniref:Uncharacterized protein n=1 Tax=Anabaena cylindrica (strain ATCC 27899 / PCC 7122) TaxID=272123 RepID=K9ZHN4_ANACC|nr:MULTISPECIES: hypothetical protein [Anabaena]AFZ58259.1 hypothetical protein Anacy_2827 [Anabaena cylindrica PCC 7122]MBD2419907.1 hypothetical protein [Anabaena cylindrica FACHB-243]MBY5281033.1 hypothetical protein [Anabaena sp. CCAP 1446/1C]MBY5307316.1 hypothetical protein [Anabaena sp. CCAP 1446/1C]MCM2407891.1 hypothetical protein [Anabaena sp. CCAP 1446/1C]
MWEDPIIQEIYQFREAHSSRFNNDLQAIYQDLKEQEKRSNRKFVSYAPKLLKDVYSPDTI